MTDPAPTPEGPTPTESVFAGGEFDVTYTDGRTERIKVHEMEVIDFNSGVATAGAEPALVDWFCRKPPGWSLTLKPRSFNLIYKEGARLNADFFESFNRRTETLLKQFKMAAPDKFAEMFAAPQSSNFFRKPL